MAVDYASAIIEYGGVPYTTTLLDLAKQLAGVVGAQQDQEYTLYLQMAGEAAENYCDNKLVNQTVTELHKTVQLPKALRFWPFTELTTVTINGDDVTVDYSTYSDDGVTYLTKSPYGSTIETKFEQMNITYNAGYDPIPADVGYAIARSAVDYQQDNPQDAARVKKETVVGVGSLEYDLDNWKGEFGVLTQESLTILDKYKRMHL